MAYLALSGANGLDLLGETLDSFLEVEAVTMEAVVAMEAFKPATADDDKGLTANC